MKTRTSTAGLCAVTVMSLTALPAMFGQAAPAASQAAPEAAPEGEVVVLSPFVVSANDEKGSYIAKDTLAGSRLRTELKDVGSAISVVTDKFMSDLNVHNSQELLKYTTSTEVGGATGNFSGVGNAAQVNENTQLVKPNANTRVRGLTAADNTRDFFLTDIPWDGYNVGRVDMQRGPNAILFGMGSPAGIINTSLNDAGFKDANKLEFRTDKEGSYRSVLDFNKVLLADELAVRLSGLSDRTYYRQEPAYNFDKRIYGALRFDPAFLKQNGMATSLKIKYENGKIRSNQPRSLTPGDQITPWWTAMNKATYDAREVWAVDGSGARNATLSGGAVNPIYSPYAATGVYAGVYGNPLAIYPYGATSPLQLRDIEANAQEQYWGIGVDANGNVYDSHRIAGIPFARLTGIPTYSALMQTVDPTISNLGVYKDRTLSDSGVFDFYNHLLDGDNKKEWRGFDAANFNLSQTFFENRIGLEAVYDKQRYHDGQFYGVNQAIYLDNNTYFLDGTPDLYTGSAMVQTNDAGALNFSDSEATRFTGFGELRSSDFFGRGLLSKLIGRHTFTGMLAEEKRNTRHLDFLRYAMPNEWADLVSGPASTLESVTDANGVTTQQIVKSTNHFGINSGYRQITGISYLSESLAGVASPSDIHLGRVTNQLVPTYNGSMYRLGSDWQPSRNPSASGYIDPAAPWTPGANQQGSFQADNPANYNGWGNYHMPQYWSYEDGDAAQLYNNGNKSYRDVKTQAYIWQGYMLDDTLVGTVGWRKDKYVGATRNMQAGNYDGQILDLDPAYRESDYASTTAESLSYSLVAHTPRFLKDKMPWNTNISLSYNRSSNIQPRPTDTDISGEMMPNPDGKTKDFGFVLNTLNDRISLKVNWYDTKVHTDRLQGFNFGAAERAVTMLLNRAAFVHLKDPGQTSNWDATNYTGTQYPTTQAKTDHGAELVYEAFTNNPLLATWLANWGSQSPVRFDNALEQPINQWLWWAPSNIQASSDTVSKGVEFELNARPVENWNISVNISKTKATQQNIGGALVEWVETLDALFKTDAGDLRDWWAGGNPLSIVWNQNVMGQYSLLRLNEGSNVPELRPWRLNFVSDYNFSSGYLKGVNIGGAVRWESGSKLGYPVRETSTEGVYTFDIAHPWEGKSETHYDMWIGYSRKLTAKIDWRIQLNLKNLFASKKLIPVSVEPDGTPAVYRLPELTSWQITNTFSF